jgi:PAS domain S-box-containing protein
MTIHNLSPEANIMFASESITDILGYQPHEVTGRSCFDYFHPEQVPFARSVHSRGVELDQAAVLHYAQIQNREGQWIGCECVFTVVHDVLVACTSIYRGDAKNERRAAAAPDIRRRFVSSPRDPRYHMLEYLSAKFRTPIQAAPREPRAALILNRFTRTLRVLYATEAVSDILGVTSGQLMGKSFYECIQENCQADAIRCLESAKANDSIAYLRFWYRDPRRPEDLNNEVEENHEMPDLHSSDSEDGGVELNADVEMASPSLREQSSSQPSEVHHSSSDDHIHRSGSDESRAINPPSESPEMDQSSSNAMSDQAQEQAQASRSSTTSSSVLISREAHPEARSIAPEPQAEAFEPFEIEAVVSCTSDGLVVVLRRARPMIPQPQPPQQAVAAPQYANGFFAAPWGANPIRAHQYQAGDPQLAFQHRLMPDVARAQVPVSNGGPPAEDFMNAIREVAVFAWSLAGINGNIAAYGRGTPRGEAQPPGGLPIWDPHAQPNPLYYPPENQAVQRWRAIDQKNHGQGHDNKLPWQYLRQEEQYGYHNNYTTNSFTSHSQPAPPSMQYGQPSGYEHYIPASRSQYNSLGNSSFNMNTPNAQFGANGDQNGPANQGHAQYQGTQENSHPWH